MDLLSITVLIDSGHTKVDDKLLTIFVEYRIGHAVLRGHSRRMFKFPMIFTQWTPCPSDEIYPRSWL